MEQQLSPLQQAAQSVIEKFVAWWWQREDASVNVAAFLEAHPDGLDALNEITPAFVATRAWDGAITLANNLCVQLSDRYNGDDLTVQADVANECAKAIRPYIGGGHAILQDGSEQGRDTWSAALTQEEVAGKKQLQEKDKEIATLKTSVEKLTELADRWQKEKEAAEAEIERLKKRISKLSNSNNEKKNTSKAGNEKADEEKQKPAEEGKTTSSLFNDTAAASVSGSEVNGAGPDGDRQAG